MDITFDGKPIFFGEPFGNYYKIYSDGGHLIGSHLRQGVCTRRRSIINDDYSGLFDSIYYEGHIKLGLRDSKRDKSLSDYIKSRILEECPDCPDVDGVIADGMRRMVNNLYHRKKRFRRKAYLNRWNYFVTFTFDDDKHSAETFKQKIKKCLSNFHSRRGWRYMGVFEEAPETGRLHFHGLLYVPDGEMVGSLEEKKDYSTAQHRMQTRVENSFFAYRFGRNDFAEINDIAVRYGKTIDYIMKYIGKTGERIVYSRGIPTEICKQLTDDDIITEMIDFVGKYILFDSVLDWDDNGRRIRQARWSFVSGDFAPIAL